MAVFNMRVNPNTPVSKALGFNPRGVVVQNYTPYWLYFPQADQYCPPWTDGWTTPLLLNSNAGYGYMQIQTPIGRTVQTNVTTGVAQFVNLQWTDNDVVYSEGTPGDTGQSVDPGGDSASSSVTTNLTVYATFVVPFSTGFASVAIAGIATKRIRIHTMNVMLQPFGGNPPTNYDSAVVFALSQTGIPNSGMAFGRVSLAAPMASLLYPNGLDFPVGIGATFTAIADFASNNLGRTITYSILG